MNLNVSIEINHHLTCRCGKELTGSSVKWLYFALLLHTQRCDKITKAERPALISTAWQLFRWKQ